MASTTSSTTVSPEQAAFFRAELARTPRDFITLDTEEIDAELDRRWAVHTTKGETFLFEDELSDEDARSNSVVYCGVDPCTKMHKYKKCAAKSAPTPVAGHKRKHVVTGEFLQKFKKGTLQGMCEDLDIPISGNKADLVERIVNNALGK